MKIGLPKLRLSRKLLLITLGITVILGGTGVTALYFGGNGLVMEGGESAIGGECTDIQTMVVKTPSDHLWLRKFIRMENKSGQERVRTALRIAGLLAKKHAVDLIHVSVLDAKGPATRAQMRARSIGAEVLIALKPDNLPEMKSPAMASYYEGPASDEGRFYGDKVVMDIDEIGAMMTAMRTVEEKPDCVNPNAEAEEAAKKSDQGKKDKKEGHEKKSDPASKPGDAHGEQPAKEGDAENAHGEKPAEEQSFVDSMLSMVGLGGSDPAPAEDHAPVAEEPADTAPGKHNATEPAEDHDATAVSHDAAPVSETDQTAKDGKVEATKDGHGAQDDAASHAPVTADAATEHDSAKAEDHSMAPSDEHDTKAAEHVEEPAHLPAKAEDHPRQKTEPLADHVEAAMPVGD